MKFLKEMHNIWIKLKSKNILEDKNQLQEKRVLIQFQKLEYDQTM